MNRGPSQRFADIDTSGLNPHPCHNTDLRVDVVQCQKVVSALNSVPVDLRGIRLDARRKSIMRRAAPVVDTRVELIRRWSLDQRVTEVRQLPVGHASVAGTDSRAQQIAQPHASSCLFQRP